MRHEKHHVTQFQGNTNQPPASFAAMMGFEEQAYGSDETWLKTAAVKNFMRNTIGTDQAVIDRLAAIAKQTAKQFKTWNNDASLTTNADRRDAMKGEQFLPASVRGKVDYSIPDLYRTKAP
jgi:hypothetical protein